ncbi:MAG: carbonic anhydrase [Thermodesulfovibrionales bacterium]|nr:carbonic anhydrase [Thermodesulfovibrionales bacterium]
MFLLSSIIFVIFFIPLAFASSQKGEEAYTRLMDGNRRFISGNISKKDLGELKRRELAKGQHPVAIVVTCSDSRVPPEIIFDQGLGELFVIRVAGNVVDPVALGSIEYAAEHLHVPLLIVLGHSNCGAVTAAVDAKGKTEGNIGAIVKKILPAVRKAEAKGGSREEIISRAIRENVLLVQEEIQQNSPVLKGLIERGALKLVGAVYDISSGAVEIIK